MTPRRSLGRASLGLLDSLWLLGPTSCVALHRGQPRLPSPADALSNLRRSGLVERLPSGEWALTAAGFLRLELELPLGWWSVRPSSSSARRARPATSSPGEPTTLRVRR